MIEIAVKDPSGKYDCEGVKCTSNAVYQMKLTVQNIGTITLLLCEKCLSHFLNDGDQPQ